MESGKFNTQPPNHRIKEKTKDWYVRKWKQIDKIINTFNPLATQQPYTPFWLTLNIIQQNDNDDASPYQDATTLWITKDILTFSQKVENTKSYHLHTVCEYSKSLVHLNILSPND